MNRRLTILLALLLGPFASADDEPQRWLEDMDRAFLELSYDGIVSHFSGGDLATLRIVHMQVDGEQRERLVHLNGAPRQIIRRGKKIVCMLAPDDALLSLGDGMASNPLVGAFARRYSDISSLYGVAFSGDDRIADRPAVRLAVTPRDEHRYGHRLWLDRETRLLLRSELVDVNEVPLEIFQFNQVTIGPAVDAAALEPDPTAAGLVNHLTLASDKSRAVETQSVDWQATWLPAGFALVGADVRSAVDSATSVTRMMYTDGLAAFSIFIEALPHPDVWPVQSRDGATVAVTHLLDPAASDGSVASVGAPHLVTVVGEIPVLTAERIARSILPREDT